MIKPLARLLLIQLAMATTVHAQQPSASSEIELKACLLVEREGMNRFKALEARASVLRTREDELRNTRQMLEKESIDMGARKAAKEEVAQFNARVDKFNAESDQFNQTKEEFDRNREDYEAWVSRNLKPKCSPFQDKPIAAITIFYACGFDQASSAFEQVPFCSSLSNKNELRDCVKKAGNKSKALETCGLVPKK